MSLWNQLSIYSESISKMKIAEQSSKKCRNVHLATGIAFNEGFGIVRASFPSNTAILQGKWTRVRFLKIYGLAGSYFSSLAKMN
jgi:hypothetical protein